MYRYYRTRPPLHGPHRGRPDDPEIQPEGAREWGYNHLDVGYGEGGAREGVKGARAFHGILQSHIAVWGESDPGGL